MYVTKHEAFCARESKLQREMQSEDKDSLIVSSKVKFGFYKWYSKNRESTMSELYYHLKTMQMLPRHYQSCVNLQNISPYWRLARGKETSLSELSFISSILDSDFKMPSYTHAYPLAFTTKKASILVDIHIPEYINSTIAEIVKLRVKFLYKRSDELLEKIVDDFPIHRETKENEVPPVLDLSRRSHLDAAIVHFLAIDYCKRLASNSENANASSIKPLFEKAAMYARSAIIYLLHHIGKEKATYEWLQSQNKLEFCELFAASMVEWARCSFLAARFFDAACVFSALMPGWIGVTHVGYHPKNIRDNFPKISNISNVYGCKDCKMAGWQWLLREDEKQITNEHCFHAGYLGSCLTKAVECHMQQEGCFVLEGFLQ
eukprot:g3397.t1